jgi:putative peptidoglycan lipid II flippase
LAATFGASEALDAFLIGFSFVRTLGLLLSASVAGSLIPLFVTMIQQNRPMEMLSVTQRWICSSLVFLLALSILLAIFAEPVVSVLGPGLDTAGLKMLQGSLHWLLPLLLILGFSGLTKTIADSMGRYFADPLLRGMTTVGLIVGVLFLSPKYGVTSAPIGAVGGAILGLLLQFLAIGFGAKLRWSGILQLRGRGSVHTTGIPYRNMVELLLASVLIQAQGIVERAFASQLAAGSVVALSLATSVASVPVTLLLPALSAVLLPHIVRQDLTRRSHFGLSLSQYLAILLPFALLSLLLWPGSDITVHYLFMRGRFSQQAAQQTSLTIRWLSLGLVPYASMTILRQVLIARGQTGKDLVASAAILAMKLALLPAALHRFGLVGIAVTGNVAMALSSGLYVYFIRSSNRLQEKRQGSDGQLTSRFSVDDGSIAGNLEADMKR